MSWLPAVAAKGVAAVERVEVVAFRAKLAAGAVVVTFDRDRKYFQGGSSGRHCQFDYVKKNGSKIYRKYNINEKLGIFRVKDKKSYIISFDQPYIPQTTGNKSLVGGQKENPHINLTV